MHDSTIFLNFRGVKAQASGVTNVPWLLACSFCACIMQERRHSAKIASTVCFRSQDIITSEFIMEFVEVNEQYHMAQ